MSQWCTSKPLNPTVKSGRQSCSTGVYIVHSHMIKVKPLYWSEFNSGINDLVVYNCDAQQLNHV
jgi:hypothetical protein